MRGVNMIGIISLFIPPLLMTYLRDKILKKNDCFTDKLLKYIFAVLALNFVMIVILCYGFGSKDQLFYKLNYYNEFALKYMFLSMVLGVAEPFAEKMLRTRVSIKNAILAGATAHHYYPDVKRQVINITEFPELEKSVCYWLIVGSRQKMEDIYIVKNRVFPVKNNRRRKSGDV
jgi:dolichyl-phosphate-mannose--protein O-mannosyl transferase